MDHQFSPGDQVVYVQKSGQGLTFGRVYDVTHFTPGPKIEIVDDAGNRIAEAKSAFVFYTPLDMVETLETIDRIRRRLTNLLAGIPKDGVLGELHTKLADNLEDVETLLSASGITKEITE